MQIALLEMRFFSNSLQQLYPEEVTPENQAFVSEVISEKLSSPLRAEPWERGQWTKNSIRCGLIAKKIGIYPMWTKDGTRILTTLLQASGYGHSEPFWLKIAQETAIHIFSVVFHDFHTWFFNITGLIFTVLLLSLH